MNHSLQYTVIKKILYNWKNALHGWNSIVSPSVILGKSSFVFPVPDATLIDEIDDNNYNIAIEFKSTLENKRGALTALGQAIAYTQKYSLSYLVIPEEINGTNLENYMHDLFISKKLNSFLPIGLISYNTETYEPKLVLEINTEIQTCPNIRNFIGTYWATFRDSYPDSIWRILDLSYNNIITADKKKFLWDKFYYEYLLPIPESFWEMSCTNLNDWTSYSKTYTWNSTEKQQIGKKKIDFLIKEINLGRITLDEAKKNLKNKYFTKKTGDVPYTQLQKNLFNCINNLNLLDDFYNLTESGFHLHKIGKLHGSTSEIFKRELTKIILIDGKHLDLIIEISNLQKEIILSLNKSNIANTLSTKEYKLKVLNYIINDFEEKGRFKRNPSRTVSGTRKQFSSEFQLWGALGLLGTSSGRNYFTRGIGYNFNWDKITSILLS